MAVALEGVELLAVVLTLACLGLALAIQHGLLRPLAAVLAHTPVVGGALAGRIDSLGNAMVGYLVDFLGYQLRLMVTLWRGMTEVFGLIVNAPLELANKAIHAFSILRNVTVPALLHAAIAPITKVAHSALSLAESGWTYAHNQVARLDGKINHWVAAFEHEVAAPWRFFQGQIWPEAKHELDAAFHAATVTLPAEIAAAEGEAGRALTEAGTIGARVEAAVSEAVGNLPAEVLAAERAVAAEIPGLAGLDLPDIEKLLKDLPWASLAGLLAAIPLLRILAQTIAAESGLDRAECRRKVRGICSTDPLAWERLLAGLLPIGVGFGLAELIEAGIRGVHEAEGLIDELAA